MGNPAESVTDEIEVTELVERIESLEKENRSQKETIEKLSSRVVDCEDSIDELGRQLRSH